VKAQNIYVTHKGVMVAITADFPPDFYEGFVERCWYQIEEVLAKLDGTFAPVECVEVQPGRALVHFKNEVGGFHPTYATEVIEREWRWPAQEHLGVQILYGEYHKLFKEYGVQRHDSCGTDGCPFCTREKLEEWLAKERRRVTA
jgi:hypothetical protein